MLSVSLYNTAVWLMQTAGECVNCEDEATLQYTNERDYFLFCETCAREKFDNRYDELRRTGFLKKWRKKNT